MISAVLYNRADPFPQLYMWYFRTMKGAATTTVLYSDVYFLPGVVSWCCLHATFLLQGLTGRAIRGLYIHGAHRTRYKLVGSTEATRLDLLSREEKRENQVYCIAKIGYNMRWVVEGVFSIFKRVFGEHVIYNTMGEYSTRCTA